MPCDYIFRKGARKGEPCGKDPVDENGRCRLHGNKAKESQKSSSSQRPIKTQNLASTVVRDGSGSVTTKHPADALLPPVITSSAVAEGTQSVIDQMASPQTLPNDQPGPQELPGPEVLYLNPYASGQGPELPEEPALPPEPTQPLSQDDIDKELLIKTYYIELPWLEKEMPIKMRGDKSADEWIGMIHMKTSGWGIDRLLLVGLATTTKTVEAVAPTIGIKANGYTKKVFAIPNLKDLVTLIRIRNQDRFVSITPEYQLGAMLLMALVETHTQNMGDKTGLENIAIVAEQRQEAVNATVLEEMRKPASRSPTYKE
jgi:hypothetical protein